MRDQKKWNLLSSTNMQYTNLSFHKGSTTKDESNQNLLSVCLVFDYFWFFHEGKAYKIPSHSVAFAFSGATVMYQQHRIRVVRNHKKCCQCPRSAILIDAESQIGCADFASKIFCFRSETVQSSEIRFACLSLLKAKKLKYIFTSFRIQFFRLK
jgi:hypothetical protein